MMNKHGLVKAVAEKTGLTQEDAAKFLDSFTKVVCETLAQSNDVSIVGFGSFVRVERSARIGRDFKTGKSINVPAHRTVRFKSGKGMKNAVV